MNHNPNECDIVQDLLPLYYDHACSPASCELVRQHLADCADCEKIYEDLANHTIDNVIETESCEILERHAKKERNLAYKAGIVIAALLLVPILITFIVSMAGGSGLGVFSVVTASMMLVAALTVVPLISSQKRLMKCILCGVGALLLILFFVNAMNGGGEFFFWSVPTVFGLSVVFFPLVIREMTLPPVLSDKKASLKTGCIVATVLMIGVWLFFLIIRYLPVNGFIKGGLCTLLCSIWITFSNDVCSYLLYDTRQLTIRHANFSTWTTDLNVNANVYVILLVAGILISALLIGIGIVKKKK